MRFQTSFQDKYTKTQRIKKSVKLDYFRNKQVINDYLYTKMAKACGLGVLPQENLN